MEYILSLIVDDVIREMHQYNSMLQYRPAQDAQCLIQRGKIEGLCELLKELGHPLTISNGRVWHHQGMHYESGYGCIMFAKGKHEDIPDAVLLNNNFENGIYWFIEGSASLTQYKGRR